MSELICQDVEALSAELALGILAGDERADALRHVSRCASCQRKVEALAFVADELLLAAPEIEPPAGFEARVMARLADEARAGTEVGSGSEVAAGTDVGSGTEVGSGTDAGAGTEVGAGDRVSPDRRLGGAGTSAAATGSGWAAASSRAATGSTPVTPGPAPTPRLPAAARADRRWRRTLLSAAAALALVAAGLAGAAVARRGGTGSDAVRTTTVSYGAGHWTCRVAAFPGQGNRPVQLVVRLDEPSNASGSYTVEVEPANGGAAVRLGMITVVGGMGVLDAPVPSGTGKVDAIRVVGPSGALHYRATFSAV